MMSRATDPAARPAGAGAPARIDRARLDAAAFPVVVTVATRFTDVDVLRHVNNVAAVGLLQEGRTAFDRAAGLAMIDHGLRTMIAGLVVEYAAELSYPDAVEIRTGLLGIGRSSFTLAQVARQGGRPALYSTATLVMTDAAGPAAIPDAVRAVYQRLRITPC